jgi:uncharacterized protein YccT (UPF0319 family)
MKRTACLSFVSVALKLKSASFNTDFLRFDGAASSNSFLACAAKLAQKNQTSICGGSFTS